MDLLAEQRRERKRRVLDTARRLIEERGYEAVSMRELARESRVSVPTLYKLFGDKNALLLRAVESQFVALLNLIDRAHMEDGLELLLALPEGCAREILRTRKYSRSVIGVFAGSGQVPGVSDVVARALSKEFQVALEKMQAANQLQPWVDPRVLSERLATHQTMVCLEWAGGHLTSEGLRAAMDYGACMMLMGVTRGAATETVKRRAREAQSAAAVRWPGTKPKKRSDSPTPKKKARANR
ncbi:MAG: TetR/AcrR family transcriptional regulator [Proteobacteria bacterium]|nr:TetR/AcrR family transcriptional regulator [Pseudomonadota bacterium]